MKKKKKKFFLYKDKLFLYIILGIGLFFSIFFFDPKIDVRGGDNAHYIILAKSLITTYSYSDIHKPGAPPHTFYPPGYPFILAPFVGIFKDNYIPLKILSMAFFLGLLWFSYNLLKKYTKDYIAFISTLFVAIAPDMVKLSYEMYTEVPCLFFILLTLFLFEKNNFIFGTLCMIVSFYIRQASIGLIFGVFLYFLYKKEYKKLILAVVITLALTIPWQLRNINITPEQSYVSQFLMKNPYDLGSGRIGFTDIFTRFFTNIKIYIFTVLPQIFLPSINIRTPLVGIIFAFLIIYGIIINKKINILIFYFFVYCGVIFLWPEVWSGARFLIPIFPLIFFYAINGIKEILKKLSTQAYYFIGCSIIFAFFIINFKANLDHMQEYSPDWVSFLDAAKWVKENTEKDCIVMSRKEGLFYLFSNRKNICYPFTYDTEKIMESILINNIDYVIVDAFMWTATTPKYLIPAIEKYKDKFRIVYRTEEPYTYVLKVVK